MDIYLGAKCVFCISSSLGWDGIPEIFRRPIVYTNLTPFGYLRCSGKDSLNLVKHYFLTKEGRELTLSEIFSHGVGFSLFSSDYESKGIQLIENTPEEIRDAAIEMDQRLNGSWQTRLDDVQLQEKFWKIFPVDAVDSNGTRLHGKIRARFGAQFLRNNPEWLC
jgi:putative glycosyltransferase (TIGR04372 family)